MDFVQELDGCPPSPQLPPPRVLPTNASDTPFDASNKFMIKYRSSPIASIDPGLDFGWYVLDFPSDDDYRSEMP